ncbi:hypothetical protein C7M84_016549 [Penaeus vannamei]|uniref:Uncharacterized protein n=1 Tax=Penaeus vannamei TaxID=6689 RepID=A0A423SMP9_PENVA|nr:hypothetical protein C7M84_016549 [Penaeus vannamei]
MPLPEGPFQGLPLPEGPSTPRRTHPPIHSAKDQSSTRRTHPLPKDPSTPRPKDHPLLTHPPPRRTHSHPQRTHPRIASCPRRITCHSRRDRIHSPKDPITVPKGRSHRTGHKGRPCALLQMSKLMSESARKWRPRHRCRQRGYSSSKDLITVRLRRRASGYHTVTVRRNGRHHSAIGPPWPNSPEGPPCHSLAWRKGHVACHPAAVHTRDAHASAPEGPSSSPGGNHSTPRRSGHPLPRRTHPLPRRTTHSPKDAVSLRRRKRAIHLPRKDPSHFPRRTHPTQKDHPASTKDPSTAQSEGPSTPRRTGHPHSPEGPIALPRRNRIHVQLEGTRHPPPKDHVASLSPRRTLSLPRRTHPLPDKDPSPTRRTHAKSAKVIHPLRPRGPRISWYIHEGDPIPLLPKDHGRQRAHHPLREGRASTSPEGPSTAPKAPFTPPKGPACHHPLPDRTHPSLEGPMVPEGPMPLPPKDHHSLEGNFMPHPEGPHPLRVRRNPQIPEGNPSASTSPKDHATPETHPLPAKDRYPSRKESHPLPEGTIHSLRTHPLPAKDPDATPERRSHPLPPRGPIHSEGPMPLPKGTPSTPRRTHYPRRARRTSIHSARRNPLPDPSSPKDHPLTKRSPEDAAPEESRPDLGASWEAGSPTAEVGLRSGRASVAWRGGTWVGRRRW